MKHLLLALFLGLSFSLSAQTGFNFGGGLTYDFESKNIGIQAKGKKGLTEAIDLELSGSYFFKKGSPFAIDVNAHYNLVSNESFSLSPFAGLNYVSAKANDKRVDDLGVNVGVELGIPVQELNPYLQAKYVFDGIGGFVLSTGVYF